MTFISELCYGGMLVICMLLNSAEANYKDTRWKIPPPITFWWHPEVNQTITWSLWPNITSPTGTQAVNLMYSQENTTTEYLLTSAKVTMWSPERQNMTVVGDMFPDRLVAWYKGGNITCTFKDLTQRDTGRLTVYIDFPFPMNTKTALRISADDIRSTDPVIPDRSRRSWFIPLVALLSGLSVALTVALFILVRKNKHKKETKKKKHKNSPASTDSSSPSRHSDPTNEERYSLTQGTDTLPESPVVGPMLSSSQRL